MPWSIFTAAVRRISSVTWAYTFSVVLLETWPMIVDNVFTSIPCSRACSRECVSEVVKSNLFTSDSFQDCLQSLSDSGWVSWGVLADWGRKHPPGVHGFFVGIEDIQNRHREDHAAVVSLGFGWRSYQLALYPMNLSLYTKFPSAKVEVIPLEGAYLTTAQSRGEFQQEKLEATVFFGLAQQTLDFLRRKHLHFSGFGGGETAAISWIAEEEPFSNGLVQCGMEGGVDAPNSLVGQSFTI